MEYVWFKKYLGIFTFIFLSKHFSTGFVTGVKCDQDHIEFRKN